MLTQFSFFLTLLGFVLQVPTPIPAQANQSLVPSLSPIAKADDTKEAVIIERYATRAAYRTDGSSTRETEAVFRVQAEAGVQSLAVLVFPYNSANETVDVDYVRVRKPDGALVVTPAHNMQDVAADLTSVAPMYSDVHEKHIPVKALGVGDVLEYLVRYRTLKPPVPGQFWFEYTFFKNIISKDEELEISVPRDKYVKVSSRELQPRVKDENSRRTYIWKTANLVREENDTQGPELEEPQPSVQITTYHSWEEVGHWYGDLQKAQVGITPEIRAKAAGLTTGLTNDDQKIRALYNFVSTHVHYISLSFGIGRYQPHAANEVLDNGYGDCKDKHTLLTALLKAAGYDAWPALINSSRYINPDVPSPSQFDHVITVLPRGTAFVWLDTTPEVAPFGMLLPNLRDKQALVIQGEKPASLIKTPATPPFANRDVLTIEAKLKPSGPLVGHVRQSVRGDREIIYRLQFRQYPQTQWKDLLQRYPWFGGTVDNVTASTPDNLDLPFEIAYDYTRTIEWEQNRKLIPPLLPPFGFEVAEEASKKPKETIYLGTPGQEIHEAKVYVPHGYKPILPRSSDVKNEFAEYHSKYSLAADVFTVEQRLVIKKSKVPSTTWNEYRTFCKAVLDDENGIYDRGHQPNTPAVLILLFIPGLIATFVLWKRSLRDFLTGRSADASPDPYLTGIGGWLVLYIIALWLTVVTNLRLLTTKPGLLFSVVDLGFAALAAVTAVMLMSRNSNGVKLAKILQIVGAVFSWVLALGAAMENNLPTVKTRTLSLMVACLWWMYLVRSKRVRSTYRQDVDIRLVEPSLVRPSVIDMRRYCLVCRKEIDYLLNLGDESGPKCSTCCTEGSLVATKVEGLFRQRRYFTLDGKPLTRDQLVQMTSTLRHYCPVKTRTESTG